MPVGMCVMRIGRLHFVDVLPALAARAERVDPQIVRIHDDLDFVVDFRDHENRRERRVAPRLLVERRNAHETMHAAFAAEHAIGVLALDLHRGGLDASFFTRRRIEDVRAEAFVLGPAEIHAQQHFGPILRFGAARARLDGEDGVQVVVVAAEKRFRFEPRGERVGGGDFFRDVFENGFALRVVGFFLREMEIGLDVARFSGERFLGVDAVFELLALLQDRLGLFLVVPEIRSAGFFFDCGYLFRCGGRVKDSSARARCVLRARRSVVAGLRCVQPFFNRTHEIRKWKIETRREHAGSIGLSFTRIASSLPSPGLRVMRGHRARRTNRRSARRA